MNLSVVIPVYGCPGALKSLHDRLTRTLLKITSEYEIILVNDCCPKNSWQEIEKICKEDKKVIGINLSKNFGQIRAITAGLNVSKGDYIVVMDCDLQDRPEAIIDLYNKIIEGFDIVFVRRKERKDTFVTKVLSKLFYKVYSYFVDIEYDSSIGNFSIASRKVTNAYCSLREQYRDYPSFLMWLGFKQTTIDEIEDERYEGVSSYTFRKKLALAFEILVSQSNKPLMFAIKTGFIISALSFIYIIYLIIRHFCLGDLLSGWTSLIASIFLTNGLVIITIGIVGIYVGNVFNEVKGRPLYIIKEVINGKEKE